MQTIVAQIAPQRSTQYAALTNALAPQELKLSPLGPQISSIDYLELGGQAYLKFELPTTPDEKQLEELAMLAMSRSFFYYYDRLGEVDGPLLRPIETQFTPLFPADLVMTRRYKGKTNESFTHFLCNIARFSSGYSHRPWNTLRVFDPLAGGGTTLFAALIRGADVAGVEQRVKDVQSTASFVQQYMKEHGIACQVRRDRLKKFGHRWWFTLGKNPSKQCVLANGETADSVQLLSGFKQPHLIISDLPYGIQHHGKLIDLLSAALPVWTSILLPNGVITFAWESTRFPRSDMVNLVESTGPLDVLDDAPYNQLAHRVDRVIKQRDVLVARLAEPPEGTSPPSEP
jgi:hypothetical protein